MPFLQRFRTFPFYIVGVIIFFLTHGYSEYVGLIPLVGLLQFFLLSLIPTLVLFWLCYRLYRNYPKAGLVVFLLLGFYLFYGAISDGLAKLPVIHPLSRYRYLILLFLALLILLMVRLKRHAGKFQRLTFYLNTLFAFFIAYDLVVIAIKAAQQKVVVKGGEEQVLNKYGGNFNKRPDIYFILLDEYNGSRGLRTHLQYDNSAFENALRERGFFVAKAPSSNYSLTPFSMASMLSMDCLPWVSKNKGEDAADFARAGEEISNNKLMQFLQSKGYRLYNHSIFDIGDQPSQFNTGLLSFKLKLITAKTLYSRIEKDLSWNIHAYIAPKVNWLADNIQGNFKAGNEKMIRLTKEVADVHDMIPKFVYTHLMMPHAPFLYDSLGRSVYINSFDTSISQDQLYKAYLQYLVYTNKRMIEFVSTILAKTNRQAVVILMSDHGYRDLLANGQPVESNDNFNSIYIPGGNYRYFSDSITNLNQFRAVLNTVFEMQIPLLPDSAKCN